MTIYKRKRMFGFSQRPHRHINCSKYCYDVFPELNHYAVTKCTESECKTQSIHNFATQWRSDVALVTLQRFQNVESIDIDRNMF